MTTLQGAPLTHNYRLPGLLILSLLTSACGVGDPSGVPFETVTRVRPEGNTLYLTAIEDCTPGMSCIPDRTPEYFSSIDGGRTWEQIGGADVMDILPELSSGPPSSKTECLPNEPYTCFRIEGQSAILLSLDGGQSWRADWTFPLARESFATRYIQRVLLLNDARPDTIPYDLAIGSNSSGQVPIVAMGNQGILARQSNGEWSRLPVAGAAPTPLRATTIAEAQSVLSEELFYSAVLSILFAIFLSIRSITTTIPGRSAQDKRNTWKALAPTLLALLLFVSLCFVIFAATFLPIARFPLSAVGVIPLGAFLVAHYAIMKTQLSTGALLRHLLLMIALPPAMFAACIVPFSAWAFTALPYQAAVAASTVAAGALIFLGARAVSKGKPTNRTQILNQPGT